MSSIAEPKLHTPAIARGGDTSAQKLSNAFVLTLRCPDRRGIVHAVSSFLADRGGNIDEAAQFSNTDANRFFMRVSFTLDGSGFNINALGHEFSINVAERLEMDWRLVRRNEPMRTLIMVSKLGHCIHDLLLRWKTGLLPISITGVVSNHRDFEELASSYGIPFHHVPVTAETKPRAEARLIDIVGETASELVVLARYMQVLSNQLCDTLAGRVINIHHSFLPGFKGARPYYQAYERGVKLIGATAHYVTGDLDEGPIIEQSVERADHAMTPEALTSLGRDVESVVLARAVKWHAEQRVIMDGRRTVVFR